APLCPSSQPKAPQHQQASSCSSSEPRSYVAMGSPCRFGGWIVPLERVVLALFLTLRLLVSRGLVAAGEVAAKVLRVGERKDPLVDRMLRVDLDLGNQAQHQRRRPSAAFAAAGPAERGAPEPAVLAGHHHAASSWAVSSTSANPGGSRFTPNSALTRARASLA